MIYLITREYLIEYGTQTVQNVNHEEYVLGDKTFVCGWCSPRITYRNGCKELCVGGWRVYEIG